MNLLQRLPWTTRNRVPFVKPSKRAPADRRRFVPRLQLLEGRSVPSVFHVTTTADSGPGSLRDAVAAANAHPAADIIVFDPSLSGQTITLTSGELLVTDNLRINGPGADLLTVSGNNSSRVFEFAAGTTDTIASLTVTGGLSNSGESTHPRLGGGIYNAGTLRIVACVVEGNTASYIGGGIFNNATMTLQDTTVAGNTAGAFGGGAANALFDLSQTVTLTVNGCVISGNSATEGGGG